MKKILKIFNETKWWEWTSLLLACTTLLCLGIVFESGVISILFSVFNIFTIFALGKGWFWGNIVGVFVNILYAVISYSNSLYGEMIMSLAIANPANLLSAFTWLQNSQKQSTIVKVNKKISWKEWGISCFCVAVLSIAIYYLLRFFGTAFLLVSTLSTAIGLLARYMQVRRSEFNFLCYIFVNLIGTVLWSYAAATDSSCITTAITYVIQTLMNVFAFINWINLRNKQSKDQTFEIIKKCCLEKL